MMKNKLFGAIVAILLTIGFSSCFVGYHDRGRRPHYYRPHHRHYR